MHARVGDLVDLRADAGVPKRPHYEVVEVRGDLVTLRHDHMVIHNVHDDDIMQVAQPRMGRPAMRQGLVGE